MSKKFIYGQEIIDFLEEYGYNKRGEDFEQNRNYATVTYMYAIPKGMRPQTPYVEFTVDADNDAFIFGEFFTDGRKGYSTEFDSVEDLKYFIENANYSNVDLTESISDKKKEIMNTLSKEIKSVIRKNGIDADVRKYQDVSIEIHVWGDPNKKEQIRPLLEELFKNYPIKKEDIVDSWHYEDKMIYFAIYMA